MKKLIKCFNNHPIVKLKRTNYVVNPLLDHEPETTFQLIDDAIRELSKLIDFSKINKIVKFSPKLDFCKSLEYEMNDVTMLSEKYLQQLGFDPMISYVFADKPGSMNGNWDVGTLIGYLIPVEICWYNEGKTIEFLGIGKYIKRGRQYSYGLMSTPYEKQQIEEFLQKHFGPENGFVKAVGK